MEVEFSKLKSLFLDNLVERKKINEKDKDETSIFLFLKEWKKFLDKYGVNTKEVSSSDLVSIFENGSFDTSSASDKDTSFMGDFLNELLSDENVLGAADSIDGNGKISKDEIIKFLEEMDDYDGEKGSLSLDDILSACEDIMNGSFMAEEEEEEEEEQPSSSCPSSSGGGSCTPSTPSSNNNTPSANNNTPAANNNTPTNPTNPTDPTTPADNSQKSLDNMSVDELKAEKTTASQTLQSKQDEYDKIINGEGAVEDLKKASDDAQTALEQALEQKDPQLKKEFSDAKADVDAKQKAFDENEKNILTATGERDSAKCALDNANTRVTTLEGQISTLEGKLSSASAEEKPKIEDMLKQAKQSLNDAKTEAQQAQQAFDDKEAALKALEDNKPNLQADLDTAKQTMDTVEQKITALNDDNINQLKTAFDDAKKAFDDGKAQAISSVQAEITQSQQYLNDIDNKIAAQSREEETKALSPATAETNAQDKLKALGATGDITVTQNSDGTMNAVEKGDGYEVSYTLDKDGNVISYTNAIGTFTANGNSVTMTPSDKYRTSKNKNAGFEKWCKSQASYPIDASLDDIIKQIKSSGPMAEKFISTAINTTPINEDAACVKYTNKVFSALGHPIGDFSKDVKGSNPKIDIEQATTGDIFNKGPSHIGSILLNIKQRNGNHILLTADHSINNVSINIHDQKDNSLSEDSYYKGISA